MCSSSDDLAAGDSVRGRTLSALHPIIWLVRWFAVVPLRAKQLREGTWNPNKPVAVL